MPTYKSFDVVVVPFPFTDQQSSKRRPALVLSSSDFNKTIHHSVMAMITSASHSSWPLDVNIKDLSEAGLKSQSLVRMKLFTLDHRLVQRTIGHLSQADKASVKKSWDSLLD